MPLVRPRCGRTGVARPTQNPRTDSHKGAQRSIRDSVRAVFQAFPTGPRRIPVPGNSVARDVQDRSRCVYEHDGGGGRGGGDRAARGHGVHGGGAMSARLRGIARETEAIVEAGSYRASDGRAVSLRAAVEAARAGTRMVGPGPVEVPASGSVNAPVRGSGDPHAEGRAADGPGVEASAARGIAVGSSAAQVSGAEGSVARGSAARGSGSGSSATQVSGAEGSAVRGSGSGSSATRGSGAVGSFIGRTLVEVTGESSLEAAGRLAGAGPVAVLNFASARNPGGGYLNGAQAQEEALCRASALYTCLLTAREFYDHHRAHRDPFYTDRVIHSPAVPVFRDDRGRLLDEPYAAGFLTSAAPNAGVVLRTAPERASELPHALAVRAERVLETAAAHGYRRLVLGAWGCGVFRNDPAQVAGAFRALLGPGGRFERTFEHVVFGVLDRTPGAVVLGAFERTLGRRSPQVQP
ncbi:TIGR02452 family protein [Streptomyces sp. NPDC060000]|uniref:TIGR02452 family protein n=1 Tax=Streptomyces sp. NPDC060000 TaxID=3347031 RepID=UPI0036C378A2